MGFDRGMRTGEWEDGWTTNFAKGTNGGGRGGRGVSAGPRGGRAHLLGLRYTLRAAKGWLPPFGRFAER
jgi:hypothetical protein